ncbi:hypothetical protein BGZ96_009201 [Linnemannia gamsii]|uniref:Uncharacterized protein n=1 Tax=Linnemannia gamsii TaxID=64522 RepID=A0ABQ7JWS5_9FUNG|nr:hypothetical protein BGZ96_009201 [Linnemannia gamsii]
MKSKQLSKRAGFLLASVLTISLVLVVGSAPVASLPVSSFSSSHESDYYYPDRHAPSPSHRQHPRADAAPAPSSKSDTPISSLSSSTLVSPVSRRILEPIAQEAPADTTPTHKDEVAHNHNGPSSLPAQLPKPLKPINKNAFRIVNPEPGDVWISGKSEVMSWEDLDLPDKVTFDITLIPEDPVSNPKALLLTRRPILRYAVAEDRFLEMVIPYDLISMEQLLKVQESNANFTWTQQPGPSVTPGPTPVEGIPAETTTPSPLPTPSPSPLPSPSPVSEAIDSRARLYITAYVGKTNKMVAQKSVYPVVIRKDPEWDRREPQPNALVALPTSMSDELDEDLEAGHPEDMLDKKDSDLAHMDDHQEGHQHAEGDSDMDEEDEEGEENHHHTFGSWVTETFDDWKDQGTEDGEESAEGEVGEMEDEDALNAHTPTSDEIGENADSPDANAATTTDNNESEDGEESAEGEVDEMEDEDALNAHTPTSDEIGENADSPDVNAATTTNNNGSEDDSMHMHSHTQEGSESGSESESEEGEGEGEGEGGHHHEHSHVIDPNHFQNDDDVAIWEEHADDPGYNPPITIRDAGTINITRWIDNKERFFVGAPYVMAWTFPTESEGLTGSVNVYIEDAETAQRYDIVAGNLPSDVRFIYLRPSVILVSAIPKTKIFVRARVEMDLFWAGTIQRYTGFSKTFYVERGAL